MNIYVGNLSFDVTEADVRSAFEAFGRVDAVNIIKDRDTGRPKGFGFVEMPDGEEARKAIEAMNGKELKGRAMNVNEARPKPEGGRGGGRPGGGGQGDRGRRGGGSGGGGRRY
ncbi:RNA recognition motif domain-containing protein [Desulfosarcina sp.]|uniref:RNA recognition motif domain-containing protein n=1 Tax=Desulfosarcina sp. TaxID=2027861 RepID=UPI0039710AA6